MADNGRPAVAIRIVRPYQTDEEFLANELETVGKTSVILIGAHPRPTGVILRFEVTLASGTTVLRGEGRVLGHKERAFRGQPGLSLRFTRLDPKSKALVDRAGAMREARLSGDLPSMRPAPPRAEPEPAPPPPAAADEPIAMPVSFPAPSDPALEAALTAATPAPAFVAEEMPTHVETRHIEALESSLLVDAPPSSANLVAAAPTPLPIEAPSDRDALLGRLRERAGGLSAERVAAILAAAPNAKV